MSEQESNRDLNRSAKTRASPGNRVGSTSTQRHAIIESEVEAGERVQWRKCSLSSHRDLSLTPKTHIRLLVVLVHACKLSTEETEMGETQM